MDLCGPQGLLFNLPRVLDGTEKVSVALRVLSNNGSLMRPVSSWPRLLAQVFSHLLHGRAVPPPWGCASPTRCPLSTGALWCRELRGMPPKRPGTLAARPAHTPRPAGASTLPPAPPTRPRSWHGLPLRVAPDPLEALSCQVDSRTRLAKVLQLRRRNRE